MAWKIVRNSDPDFREDCFTGICPRFGKEATITIKSVGSVMCKTDLQKTYHKSGMKCTLLDGTNEVGFSSCMEKCPLEPEKYL